jgi:SOS-response transcriptional repressor LexA
VIIESAPRDSVDGDAHTPGLRVTHRQLEVLRAARGYAIEHGRMPSVRDLAKLVSRSASTVQQHLLALERRGYLVRDGSASGFTVLAADTALGLKARALSGTVPLKGRLRPGVSYARLAAPWRPVAVGGDVEADDFAVEVDGDSLGPDGILAGDLLHVRPGPSGEQPALLVFTNGVATVRRVLAGRSTGGELLASPTPRIDRRRGRRPPAAYRVLGQVLAVLRRF